MENQKISSYSSEYQKQYRIKNKEIAKQYQKEYRKNRLKLIKNKEENGIQLSKERSRVYICQLGNFRLKIGSTYIHSSRIYQLKRRVNLIGLSLQPLYFFDCKNASLITDIEREIKQYFCSSEIGINLNSFKNEVANLKKLNEIYFYIENKLKSSGFEYEITKVEK